MKSETMEFPREFKFGTSSAALQIEGRGFEDGKGASMWDEFAFSHPKDITDRSNPNVACESYRKFEEDVFMLKSMNANTYSFTLSWSRILPNGTTRHVNQQGIDYYDDLINTLLENGIEPIVTLSDFDLPLPLVHKYAGGWINKQLIVAFESYAKLCFAKFGDRVRQWITVLDPWTQAWKGYGVGIHPPELSLGYKGAYLALTNLLKAHAIVYRLYQRKFRASQSGRLGISLSCSTNGGNSISQQIGRVMYPLTRGQYPSEVFEVNEMDEKTSAFLIPPEWTTLLQNSFDFVALEFTPELNMKVDSCKIRFPPENELSSTFSMQEVLNTMRTEFENPQVIVICTGPPVVLQSQLMDIDRAQYFNFVAKNILQAVVVDKCNVIGYLPGKLMDCWEYESGFTISHGLFQVEFSDKKKRRSPRASVVFILKHLFLEKKLQADLF